MKNLIVLIILALSFNICGQTNEISKAKLIGCWTDSREENVARSGESIYRHCDFKEFPPSRFRFKMELKDDGKCLWLDLAYNDGHKMKEGTWVFDEKTNTVQLTDLDGTIAREFVINKADFDILVIEN